MNILFIGGTLFLGRHCVESALSRHHTVTLFHRGKSNPGLFPDIEHLYGDRKHDTQALLDRKWDAVIDTCGYLPSDIDSIAQALVGNIGFYQFISSVSVYADNAINGIEEDYPIATMPSDADTSVFAMEHYGALKYLCEQRVLEYYGADRVQNIRPGLIVGQYDPSDRFTYWVRRGAEGGKIIVPGGDAYHIQYIDVRDLADWMIHCAEHHTTGTYNAVTPPAFITLPDIIRAAGECTDIQQTLLYPSDTFFEEQGIAPWSQMPVWIPSTMTDYKGFSSISAQKAIAQGLTFRSPADTVRALYEWDKNRDPSVAMRAGISREREHELITILEQNS
ncbi:MAG TPA: NAD-dependent epimerase/dehydratase family protein [Candidatus Kapabacteria bacterium]|nr:NAD-dependent epimerase/dehydratase family protein [Candidatus Kapabacteria bacterium]